MKLKFYFQIAVVTALLSQHSFADQQCISGSESSKGLIENLSAAEKNSPITSLISRRYGLEKKTEADCIDCEKSNKALLPKLEPNKTYFKEECLEAAGQIKAASNEVICPSGKNGQFRQCYTRSFFNYQNAVISDFYKCLRRTQNLPITPEALFEMYSLESGFKPYYSNSGGTGMGQLTSIFIKDLHQKHRGRPIIESIANSTHDDCEAAKIIAQKDLSKEPSLSNKCSFIQAGEGMERDVLYSLMGLANSWNKDIEPLLTSYNKKYERDPQLLKVQYKALINSYGPGGRAAARASIRRLSKLKPSDYIKAMDRPLMTEEGGNLNVYTNNLAKKQKQLVQFMKDPIKSEFQKDGARACLEYMF